MDLEILVFCRGDAGWFAITLFGLPVIDSTSCSKVDFGLSHREGCGPPRLGVCKEDSAFF